MAVRPKPPARKARALVLGALSVLAIAGTFVAAGIVSRHLFEPGPRPPRASVRAAAENADPQAAPAPDRLRVTGVEGQVEGRQGERLFRVHAGDLLSEHDILRTPPGARVALHRGATEIELRENVEIQLGRITAGTVSLELLAGPGALSTTVEHGDQHVQVHAAGSEARSRGAARWVVALDATGQVAVAVAAGAVRLRSRAGEITLGAGQGSAVRADEPPAPPLNTPEDLLLSVSWPELRGVTSPGNQVTVGGRPVAVDREGRFALPPDTHTGQAIEVRARDLHGREKAVTGAGHAPARTPRKASPARMPHAGIASPSGMP